MFQYLPEHSGDLVAIKTAGTIDNHDLDMLLPEVERVIAAHQKIKFYWEMETFTGWKPLSFFRDRTFDIKHASNFIKIAMVGEKTWQQTLANVMKPFTSGELRFFDLAERQEALEWIKKDDEPGTT